MSRNHKRVPPPHIPVLAQIQEEAPSTPQQQQQQHQQSHPQPFVGLPPSLPLAPRPGVTTNGLPTDRDPNLPRTPLDEFYVKLLEALRLMYETPDVSESARRDADIFLQAFVQNPVSWEMADRMLRHHDLPITYYFFCANALVIRLRTHFADLPTLDSRIGFRVCIFEHLNKFFTSPHTISSYFRTPQSSLSVVERLSTCLSILLLHLTSISEWESALTEITTYLLGPDVLSNLETFLCQNLYNPHGLSQLLVLFRVLASVPDTLHDPRFAFLDKGDEEKTIIQLTQFKPILLRFVTSVFFLIKPVMWTSNLQEMIKHNSSMLGYGHNALDALYSSFPKLTTLYPRDRNLYLEIMKEALRVLLTWTQARLITLEDVICFAIIPGCDPDCRFPNLPVVQLPFDEKRVFFQERQSPNEGLIEYSLYVQLVNLLYAPSLTPAVTKLLSLLFLTQPTCEPSPHSLEAAFSNPPKHITFISIHAHTHYTRRPSWLTSFLLLTIQTITNVYHRIYYHDDLQPLAISLVVLFGDFFSLFFEYLTMDPSLHTKFDSFSPLQQSLGETSRENSPDFFRLIFTSFLTLLNTTLQPATEPIVSSINKQLIDSLLFSHQTSLTAIPKELTDLFHTVGPALVPVYLFEPYSRSDYESVSYYGQCVVSRRPIVSSMFTTIAELFSNVKRTQSTYGREEDHHYSMFQQISRYGSPTAEHTEQLKHHEFIFNEIGHQLSHIKRRLDLFQAEFNLLLKIAFQASQAPAQAQLTQDFFIDTEETTYRNAVAVMVQEISYATGNRKALHTWFDLFQQFQVAYNNFLQIYPTTLQQNPNNNRQLHTPKQLVELTGQAMSFFKTYNQTSLTAIDQNVLSQPQHNLDFFTPQIYLWDPTVSPDGWQPLEQIIWALSTLAQPITRHFLDHFDLDPETQTGSNGAVSNSLTSREHGRVFSSVQFYICKYGKDLHAETAAKQSHHHNNNGGDGGGGGGSTWAPLYPRRALTLDLLHDEEDMIQFLEQLGTIFDLFIQDWHRNMHTTTLLSMIHFIRRFSSFLTLKNPIYAATGWRLDPVKKQPQCSDPHYAGLPPKYPDNLILTRLIVQVLLSFSLYPQSIFTEIPFGLTVSQTLPINKLAENPLVSHTIITMTQPENVKLNTNTATTRIFQIPQQVVATLLVVIQQNIYQLCQTHGDELYTLFSFLMRRIIYESIIVAPAQFHASLTEQCALTEVTTIPLNGYHYYWLFNGLHQCSATLISVFPDMAIYAATLSSFSESTFSVISDLYTLYQRWVESAIPKLTTFYHGINNDPRIAHQCQLYSQLFQNITWYNEAILTNVLQAVRTTFACSMRPEDYEAENIYQQRDPWALGDVPRIQIMTQMVQKSIPFFQGLVKTFSVTQYRLPTEVSNAIAQNLSKTSHNNNNNNNNNTNNSTSNLKPITQVAGPDGKIQYIIREHIIVDKIISIWSMALRDCTIHTLPYFQPICASACEFFQLTRHSSFVYLADVAIRTSSTIENAYKSQKKELPEQFSSLDITKKFTDFFTPTIFELISLTVTQQSQTRRPFNFPTESFLMSKPALVGNQQLSQSYAARLDEILDTYTPAFPSNHAIGTLRDPFIEFNHDQLPVTKPITIQPMELSKLQSFHQIHLVNLSFIELYPEVVEDYIGMLTSIRYSQPTLFLSSPQLPLIFSFLISALYSPRQEIYELTLSLFESLYTEFIYGHPLRKNYAMTACQNLIEVKHLLASGINNGPPPPGLEPISSPRGVQLRVNTPFISNIRYLNILECFKYNKNPHRPLFELLSSMTPTLITHVILSLFTPTRSASPILENPQPVLGPFLALLKIMSAFTFQNLETIHLEEYQINSNQLLSFFTQFHATYNSVANNLPPQPLPPQAINNYPAQDALLSALPLTIRQFPPHVQQAYDSILNENSPCLLRTLIDAFSIYLTPHYTTQTTLITSYYERLVRTTQQHTTSFYPIPEPATKLPDSKLLIRIVSMLCEIGIDFHDDIPNSLIRDFKQLLVTIQGGDIKSLREEAGF